MHGKAVDFLLALWPRKQIMIKNQHHLCRKAAIYVCNHQSIQTNCNFVKIYQFQCCNLCPDFGQVQHLACLCTWRWGVKHGVFFGILTGSSLEPNNCGRWPSKPTWMYFISMSPGLHLNSKRMSDSWEFDGFSTGVLGCVLVLRWDMISLPCWWMTVPFPKMPSSVFGKVLLRIRRCQRCGKIWLRAWGEILNLWHITWTAQMVGSWVAVKVSHHEFFWDHPGDSMHLEELTIFWISFSDLRTSQNPVGRFFSAFSAENPPPFPWFVFLVRFPKMRHRHEFFRVAGHVSRNFWPKGHHRDGL